MEFVFEPDLNDGEEAAALVKELTLILERLDTCSCKMEGRYISCRHLWKYAPLFDVHLFRFCVEGVLRVDANVSINRPNEPLGVRTEIKNIGSVRGVASAINYEIKRQIKIRENEGEIINETRSWDSISSQTIPMRDKEDKLVTNFNIVQIIQVHMFFNL